MIFRIAVEADIPRIWTIINQAKAQMYREGKHQWSESYPAVADIERDIASGYGYVLDNGDGVVAYGAVVFDGEPAYDRLDGRWLADVPYVVVHRLAVADEVKRRGVAVGFMSSVEALARDRGVTSFRVDTNYDNFYMLRIFDKLGFIYCGEVRYDSGLRRAYEKLLAPA